MLPASHFVLAGRGGLCLFRERWRLFSALERRAAARVRECLSRFAFRMRDGAHIELDAGGG
jgi:hypothetical protein